MSISSTRNSREDGNPVTLITEYLDTWSSAIKAKSAAGRGSSKKIDLYGIKKLRGLILELAVRGLLVPQDPNDGHTSVLLEKISSEKKKLIKDKKLKKSKDLPEINVNDKQFKLAKGWSWVRFGNIAQHNSGKTLDKGRNTGESRKYLTTSNLYWGRFELENIREMLIKDEELEKCSARTGDLLICEGGEAGRAAVWEGENEICFQNHIHRARFFGELNPYYMYRFFEKLTATGEINQHRKGVGISNMSGKSLSLIALPLPPIAEQHRIVAKVDELMALCDQLEQQTEASISAHQTLVKTLLTTLTNASEHEGFNQAWARVAEHFDTLFTTEWSIEQLKQTILQLAVMGKLVPQNPNNEPASELLKKITLEKALLLKEGKIKKQKPLPPIEEKEKPFELPVGWAWVRLGNTGIGSTGKTPSTKEEKYFNGNIHFIGPGQITPTGELIEPEKYLTEEGINYSTEALPGDILMVCIGGSIGKSVICDRRIAFNQQINALSPLLMESKYLNCAVSTGSFYQSVLDKSTGSATPIINRSKWESLLVPVSPLEEQRRIVAKVDELMDLCDSLKININTTQITQLQLADAMTYKVLN